MINVVPHHFVKETIELSEVTEDDVSTEIPRETCRIDDGSRVTTRMLLTLDEDPIFVAQALKFARAGQATRPCTDDQDARRIRSPPAATRRHHGEIDRVELRRFDVDRPVRCSLATRSLREQQISPGRHHLLKLKLG